MIQRGGTLIDSGKIGWVKPIRQEILLPGETLKCSVSGSVNMEALRERDMVRLHAHIAAFMTPVRWLEPNFPDYIKAGPDADSLTLSIDPDIVPSHIGIGGNEPRFVPSFFVENPNRIYNEWYKWPEDVDVFGITQDGFPAVNLEHSWTRCRANVTPDDVDDYTMPSGTFTVQQLSELQAKFKSGIDRDVLSYNRYMELLRDMFGADASREVDKVPILLRQDQLGVSPRVMPATDSAGLGDYASVYDFGVDFKFNVTAPEHCLLCYMLTVRFSPITEEINPHANVEMSWAERVGDPAILSATAPVDVKLKHVLDTSSNNSLGYLPAGWQWRAGWNQIGERLDIRDSFPVMRQPTNAVEARDATRRVDAFRSSALGDYRIDFYFNQQSYSPISSAMSSFTSGMESGAKGDVYPKTGKVK